MKIARVLTTALAAGLLSTALAPSLDARQSPQLTFAVNSLEPDREGEVLCALYDSEDDWLGESPFRYDEVAVEGDRVICRFRDMPKGTYAIAAMHDEDGDGEMDKNLVGLPTEGYCASRDAHAKGFGAPDWSDAAFRFNGKGGHVAANMSY